MESNEQRLLTKAERAEVAEYERIIKFAADVQANRHPTVKIPPHLLPQNQPCPLPLPDDLEIDFHADYYMDLCVRSDAVKSSIEVAWETTWKLFSPVSHSGRIRWHDPNPEVRNRTKVKWERVCIAYNILSDPVLKLKYDMGRASTEGNPVQKPSDASKSLDKQKLELATEQCKDRTTRRDEGNGEMFRIDASESKKNTETKEKANQYLPATALTRTKKPDRGAKSRKENPTSKVESRANRTVKEKNQAEDDDATREWKRKNDLANRTLRDINARRDACLAELRASEKDRRWHRAQGGMAYDALEKMAREKRYKLGSLEREKERVSAEFRALRKSKPGPKALKMVCQSDGDVEMTL